MQDKEPFPYTRSEESYEESYAEDFSREENNPKRQKALEKNARRVYDNDRD